MAEIIFFKMLPDIGIVAVFICSLEFIVVLIGFVNRKTRQTEIEQ